MIQLTKSGNAILFTFDENDHYLYNGTIEVPVNSLSLVTDSSEMFTFKKSATNDIFVSGLYSEIGMTKSELETFYKENMVGLTDGITSGEVQSMIDESISGKADTSAVTESINAAVSGKADTSAVTQSITEATSGLQVTLVSGTNIKTINNESILGSGNITISSAVTRGDTNAVQGGAVYDMLVELGEDIERELMYLDYNKQDTLISGTNIKTINNESILGSGNITISGGTGGNPTVELTQAEYDALVSAGTVDNHTYYIITDATPIDLSGYAQTSAVTEEIAAAVSGKADTSAVTESINAAVSGKVDTSAVTTSVTSASTDSQIPTAKAVYDAIPTGGTSITIDPSLDSGSTNPVANSAITNAINSKMDEVNLASFYGDKYSAGLKGYYYDLQTETQTQKFDWGTVWQSDGSIGFDGVGNLTVFNKLDTSAVTSSVTSASTDSQIPTAKAVYDAIPQGGGGGSITIDPTLDSGSTNAVANSAITNAINGTVKLSNLSTYYINGFTSYANRVFPIFHRFNIDNQSNGDAWWFGKINNKYVITTGQTQFSPSDLMDLQVVETSAITTSITSGSTDAQVPSAKCVYDQLGGLKLQQITQSSYDALVSGGTVDSSTVYIIVN